MYLIEIKRIWRKSNISYFMDSEQKSTIFTTIKNNIIFRVDLFHICMYKKDNIPILRLPFTSKLNKRIIKYYKARYGTRKDTKSMD